MRAGADYYSVLGVSRDASVEDLKRRYRQLVREHHPDVAVDHEAAQERFVTIVEAYRTLSDPARRRAYDAMMRTTSTPPATRTVQQQRQIDDWFRHAVHCMESNDIGGAAAQCRKILALDHHHAAAHALLGDTHAAKYEWDQALVCYSAAVSSAPRNPIYARKLRTAAEEGQHARLAAEKRERAAEQRRRALETLNARHELVPYSTAIAAAWMLALALWAVRDPGPVVAPWLQLPLRFVVLAVAVGLLLGFLLGLNGLGRGAGRGEAPPRALSAGLALMATGQFYVGLGAYCVTALVRGRLVPSLGVAFAATLACVMALTGLVVLAPETPAQAWLAALLWGGSLAFPACLAGLGLGHVGLRLAA